MSKTRVLALRAECVARRSLSSMEARRSNVDGGPLPFVWKRPPRRSNPGVLSNRPQAVCACGSYGCHEVLRREEGRCGQTLCRARLSQGRVGEVIVNAMLLCCDSSQQTKRVRNAAAFPIPSVGFGPAFAGSFNAAGVGSCCLATGSTGADYLGNRVNSLAMKGATNGLARTRVVNRWPIVAG